MDEYKPLDSRIIPVLKEKIAEAGGGGAGLGIALAARSSSFTLEAGSSYKDILLSFNAEEIEKIKALGNSAYRATLQGYFTMSSVDAPLSEKVLGVLVNTYLGISSFSEAVTSVLIPYRDPNNLVTSHAYKIGIQYNCPFVGTFSFVNNNPSTVAARIYYDELIENVTRCFAYCGIWVAKE